MLKAQLKGWEKYPDEVREHFTWIIVDDCSPRPGAAEIVPGNVNDFVKKRIQVYRITTDIKWNQHGARNLGAHLAPDGWMLVTDMDHQLLADDAKCLLDAKLDEHCFYRLGRIKAGRILESEYGHYNTFVVTKELYWKAGGYDEDYCGSYGGDSQMIRAMLMVGKREEFVNARMIRYPRDVVPDASTHTLDRKGEYRQEYLRRAAKKRAAAYRASKPLRFKWERVL